MFGVEGVNNFGIPLEKYLKMDAGVGVGRVLKGA